MTFPHEDSAVPLQEPSTVLGVPLSQLPPEIQEAMMANMDQITSAMNGRAAELQGRLEASEDVEAWGSCSYDTVAEGVDGFIFTWLDDTQEDPNDHHEQERVFYEYANTHPIMIAIGDEQPEVYQFALTVDQADDLRQMLATYVAIMRDPTRGKTPPGNTE